MPGGTSMHSSRSGHSPTGFLRLGLPPFHCLGVPESSIPTCACEVAREATLHRDAMHAPRDLLDTVLGSALRGGGCYLGEARGQQIYSGHGRSTLVLGPTRSGKTTSLIVPNILGHPGPVVATSTKDELLHVAGPSRRRRGTVALFDPSGTVDCPSGVALLGWSPLDGCEDWDTAMTTASSMVAAAHGHQGALSSHWHERAATLLSSVLHAGAIDGRSMTSVLSWIDRHDGTDAHTILARDTAAAPVALDVLEGILATADREQSSIWSTASGTLSAYRSHAALASTERERINPDEFTASADTIILCAASRLQRHYAPLLVGALGTVRDATYHASAAGTLAQPVLFALDEVANIAPLPDLPSLVSEGGGQGLLILACLQDLSQARQRWGGQADGFVSLFPTTVVLPGIGDQRTLELLSSLGGDHLVPVRSFSQARGRHGATQSIGQVFRPQWTPAALAHGAPETAIVVGPTKQITEITLTPSHRSMPWLALRGDMERLRSPSSRDLVR